MLSSLRVISLLIATSQVIIGAVSTNTTSNASPGVQTNHTGPYPVSCDYMAFGVGNITISSVQNTSVQSDILQSGPAKDVFGRPFLEQGNNPNFPVVAFQPCNSSYMNWQSYQFDANETHVSLYGHIGLSGTVVGQPAIAACLQRNSDGTVVWADCNYNEGPSQIAQYWKLVKLEANPALPGPIDFIGYANGTNSPFVYTPSYVPFNGSKIVKEQAVTKSSQPKYQLFFTLRED